MKLSIRMAIASLFLAAMPGYATFLPENDLHLQDNLEFNGGITEAEFNEVIDAAIDFYEPIIQAHGGKLSFARRWSDSTVNASAQQFFGLWIVNMYGGLARRPEITKDGFAMVVCHELGHHLAGFPYVSGWAANEGQSDYFAALSCGRNLWGNADADNAKAAATIPAYPKQLCDDAFFAEGTDRLNLCYRQMLASYSVSNLLGTLGGVKVTWDTPDPAVVSTTDDSHPQGQCRMDTYMAGTLCDASFDYDLIPQGEQAAAANSCHQANGDTDFLRPRCWFKPGL